MGIFNKSRTDKTTAEKPTAEKLADALAKSGALQAKIVELKQRRDALYGTDVRVLVGLDNDIKLAEKELHATVLDCDRLRHRLGKDIEQPKQKTAAEKKLEAAQGKVDALQRRVADVKQARANELHDAGLGYEASARRAAILDNDLKLAEGELALAVTERDKLQAEVKRQEAIEQADAVLKARQSVPVLAAEHVALAKLVVQHARAFSAAARALLKNNGELQAALILGFPERASEAKRLLRNDYATLRIRDYLWPEFMLDPDKPGLWGSDNNLLGLAPPREWGIKKWLIDLETDLVDELVRVFRTRDDAEEARARIDPANGTKTLHVVHDPRDGLFHLVPGRRRSGTVDDTETPPPKAA